MKTWHITNKLRHLVSSAERLEKLAMTALERRRKVDGHRDTDMERLASKAVSRAAKHQRDIHKRARAQHQRAATLHDRLIRILDRNKSIHEAFDAPVDFSEKTNTAWQHCAEFNIGDNLYYIEIIQCGSPSEILVNFYYVDSGDGHHEYGITGKGNALKIISTVASYTRHVIERWESIETIYFQSDIDEPSRVKLYRSLAQKAANALGWNATEEPTKQYLLFTIKKPID